MCEHRSVFTGTFLPLTAGAKQGRPVFGPRMLASALVPMKIIGATLLLPAAARADTIIVDYDQDKNREQPRDDLQEIWAQPSNVTTTIR